MRAQYGNKQRRLQNQEDASQGLLHMNSDSVLSSSSGNTSLDQGFWPFPERPKPPSSLREMAVMAMETMPDKMGSLQAVCEYISKCFPFYRQNTQWHNTLRCRMTDKKYFLRQPKHSRFTEYIVNPTYRATVDVESLKSKLQHHADIDLNAV